MSTFIRVDFPAPFSPSSVCTSPRRTSRFTSRLANTSPNRLVMCSMRRISSIAWPLPSPVQLPQLGAKQGDGTDGIHMVPSSRLPNIDSPVFYTLHDLPLYFIGYRFPRQCQEIFCDKLQIF